MQFYTEGPSHTLVRLQFDVVFMNKKMGVGPPFSSRSVGSERNLRGLHPTPFLTHVPYNYTSKEGTGLLYHAPIRGGACNPVFSALRVAE